MTIFYVVTSPDNIRKRYGRICTLALMQDSNGAQLDRIWNDCHQIYPRPHQPADPTRVVLKLTIGPKMQTFLADQTGSDNPFYADEPVRMLDVYNQFFGSLESLKIAYPELWDLITLEWVDDEGIIQIKQVTKIDAENIDIGMF